MITVCSDSLWKKNLQQELLKMSKDKHLKHPYLPLVEAGVLDGAVRFVEGLKCVGHVPIPQPGFLRVRDAE